MNKIILNFLGLMISGLTFCQVSTEEIEFNYQIAYCVGASNSTAWIGDNMVVMIEGETAADRDAVVMAQVVQTLESIISKFEELTGLDNLPIASSYSNKPVIEVVEDNCGAGGLAGHGVLGMSTGKSLFDDFYNKVSQNDMSVPQVFYYELNRNFWLAGSEGFNGKFDWAMNDEAQNWGWWTVGMNNAQAYIIPKSLNIGLDYFGNDISYWENRMVGELEDYMNDSQYDFDFGWRQSLMPWHNTESINDLMSGLFIYSYNNFGGEAWIKGFYEQVQRTDIPNRSDVFAYQECRDNIYRIWSYAAEEDLINFFENDLRWVISQEVKTTVSNAFVTTSFSGVNSQNGMKVYPNPVADIMVLETEEPLTEIISIYNMHGQLMLKQAGTGDKTHVNTSTLVDGVYQVNVGGQTVKIMKD